ncbi:MAG: hypothetical protein ACEQSU_10665 [Microgenomates group bacterium]
MVYRKFLCLIAIFVFLTILGIKGCSKSVVRYSGYTNPPTLNVSSNQWDKVAWVYQTSFAPGGFANFGANNIRVMVEDKGGKIFESEVDYENAKIENSTIEWVSKSKFMLLVKGEIRDASGGIIQFDVVTTFQLE